MTGSQGPPFSPTFINIERFANQVIGPEQPVIFDTLSAKYGDCDWVLNTSPIVLWTPGYYKVLYNIYHVEPCQFTVFLNGIPIIGTTVGSPIGASQNASTNIIYLSPADVLVTPTSLSPSGFAATLEFVNHTSYSPTINLSNNTGSGSAVPQIVATVSIFRLA